MKLNRILCALAFAGLMLSLDGCALYRDDRCYLPADEYYIARDLFIQTGSLELVRLTLRDYQWQTCKLNEALYRLQKEFEVLPEELPESNA